MATIAKNAAMYSNDLNLLFNDRFSFNQYSATSHNLAQSNADKIYLSARESIQGQYEKLQVQFKGISKGSVLSKSLKTLNRILEFNQDAISFELTTERSIIFTFKVAEFTFFFQQFFELEFEDDDEAMLSVYKNENLLPNHAGEIDEIFDSISRYLGFNNNKYSLSAYFSA